MDDGNFKVLLRRAFTALDRADVVLGPASDGGRARVVRQFSNSTIMQLSGSATESARQNFARTAPNAQMGTLRLYSFLMEFRPAFIWTPV
jgi:glycosyltransferase A (GT-A) superfamily protein (DUF2064 family)